MPPKNIIAVANQKGGVAKTTTAVTAASLFAREYGQRTLLVDFDPQGHVAVSLGLQPPATHESPVVKALVQGEGVAKHVVDSGFGFDVLLSDLDVGAVEPMLTATLRARALPAQLLSASEYDTIVIDCPPNLNGWVQAALKAATVALMPVTYRTLAVRGVVGTIGLVNEETALGTNKALRYAILPTMVSMAKRSKSEKKMRDILAAATGGTLVPYEVRACEYFQHALDAKKPIDWAWPNCNGHVDHRYAIEALREYGLELPVNPLAVIEELEEVAS